MNNEDVLLEEICEKWVDKLLDEGFDGFLSEDVSEEFYFYPVPHIEEIINHIEVKANTPDYIIKVAKALIHECYEDEVIRVAEIASRLRGDFFSFGDLKEDDDVWCLVHGKGRFYKVVGDKVLVKYKRTLRSFYDGIEYSLNGQLFGCGAITLFSNKDAYSNALIALTESQL